MLLSFSSILMVILVDCVTEFVPQNRLQIVSRHAAVRWSVYIFVVCHIALRCIRCRTIYLCKFLILYI